MKREKRLFLIMRLPFFFAPIAQAEWMPTKKLIWTLGDSARTVVVADSSDNLHIVWSDSTPGNNEIYYRRFLK